MATGKSTHVALDQHALLRIIEENGALQPLEVNATPTFGCRIHGAGGRVV